MIEIKTKEEIEIMRQGGRILAQVLSQVLKQAVPGVSGVELDKLAENLICKSGAEPAFKKVKGYHDTLCLSINDTVVHGLPTKDRLKEGDLIGIDGGVFYKGFYTDMARTIEVQSAKCKAQNRKNKVERFLETGEKALREAIKKARVGNHIGDISKTIQEIIEGAGYSIVRNLVGHGVGKDLHEEPEIPGFLAGRIEETPEIKSGMTLAIEIIYNLGGPEVFLAKDGWTIKTKDGRLSGLFERTIAVTDRGPVVLTK